MLKIPALLLLVDATSVVVTSCSEQGDRWDSTNYFESHRVQSLGQQKRLRDRMYNTQGEYKQPAHQIN